MPPDGVAQLNTAPVPDSGSWTSCMYSTIVNGLSVRVSALTMTAEAAKKIAEPMMISTAGSTASAPRPEDHHHAQEAEPDRHQPVAAQRLAEEHRGHQGNPDRVVNSSAVTTASGRLVTE